jgi:hypothetical protein
MFDMSIVVRSGQSRKGVIAAALILLGAVCAIVAFVAPALVGGDTFRAFNVGALVAVGGVLYGTLSIRCPKCRTRWVALAMRKRDVGGWLAWLLSLKACPICGEDFDLTDGAPLAPVKNNNIEHK